METARAGDVSQSYQRVLGMNECFFQVSKHSEHYVQRSFSQVVLSHPYCLLQ